MDPARAAMHELADLPATNPARLSRIDLAFGITIGASDPRASAPPPLPPGADPVAAARDAIGAAPESGTHYVAFTGGRDSAVALALIADHARRRGLPQPVPVTVEHPELPEANETVWAERVVRHLGLDDWVRVPIRGELDLLGPHAQRLIATAGPTFPATAYLLLPALDVARGASISLAMGSSDFFLFWRWWPLAAALSRQRRPRRRDLPLALLALLPTAPRSRIMGRGAARHMPPWLRPAAAREAQRLLGRQLGAVPVRFDRAILAQYGHRCSAATRGTLAAAAREADTTLRLPTIDGPAVNAMAAAGGWFARGGRTGFSRLMAGDLLPPGALDDRRAPRAAPVLDAAGGRRAFAQAWDGRGVDTELVDPEALRAVWLAERLDVRSVPLLQAAWLATQVSPSAAVR